MSNISADWDDDDDCALDPVAPAEDEGPEFSPDELCRESPEEYRSRMRQNRVVLGRMQQ